MAMPMKQVPQNDDAPAPRAGKQADPVPADGHAPVLGAEDYALLGSLGFNVTGVDRARYDMAEVLMDEETLRRLTQHEAFFEAAGIPVGATIASLQRAMRLRSLERNLQVAIELVHRHVGASVGPSSVAASDIRKLIMGTPEGSPIRAAFSQLDERWQQTFRGGRTAKAAPAEAPAPPVPATAPATEPR